MVAMETDETYVNCDECGTAWGTEAQAWECSHDDREAPVAHAVGMVTAAHTLADVRHGDVIEYEGRKLTVSGEPYTGQQATSLHVPSRFHAAPYYVSIIAPADTPVTILARYGEKAAYRIEARGWVAVAKLHDLDLTLSDFQIFDGGLTVDGMDPREWIETVSGVHEEIGPDGTTRLVENDD